MQTFWSDFFQQEHISQDLYIQNLEVEHCKSCIHYPAAKKICTLVARGYDLSIPWACSSMNMLLVRFATYLVRCRQLIITGGIMHDGMLWAVSPPGSFSELVSLQLAMSIVTEREGSIRGVGALWTPLSCSSPSHNYRIAELLHNWALACSWGKSVSNSESPSPWLLCRATQLCWLHS